MKTGMLYECEMSCEEFENLMTNINVKPINKENIKMIFMSENNGEYKISNKLEDVVG